MTLHPLDRPIWQALSTRQQALACGDALARRIDPAMGLFAAAADDGAAAQAALATLVPAAGIAWLVETGARPAPPGCRIINTAELLQMVAGPVSAGTGFFAALGDSGAAEMRALALLTEPGPFLEQTHRFGGFIGVREGGKLVAMAGTRMRPPGHVEVSGVCTHPDWRGRGLAARLTRAVAARITADGDVPYLHVYPGNKSAIAIYEALGFRARRHMVLTVLAGADYPI